VHSDNAAFVVVAAFLFLVALGAAAVLGELFALFSGVAP
jgi:hypothetical protein